ncbi:MAG: type III pantothenate kinase [Saprospiraceae bacterium]|nr:type III pantothenate kinase [Pyrinomonadaceae bacterium]
MLLAVDIGNSSIKFGIYDSETLLHKFSIPTNRNSSSKEIKQTIGNELNRGITHAIASSVVPEIEKALREFCSEHLGVNLVIVDNTFDFGMKINYDPVSSAGTDRLIAAFAAARKYGKPCIICDFGTAATIDAVSSNGEYLGGIIAPGMAVMAEVLHLKTSKLPRVEIAKPDKVIGNSTVGSIQSGIFYGYIGLVDGIIRRMIGELALPLQETGVSNEKLRIIATGGFARLIADNSQVIEIVDENLMLDGLHFVYKQVFPDDELSSNRLLG